MKLTDTLENEYANVESQKNTNIKIDSRIEKIVAVYKEWLTYMQTNLVVKQKGILEMGPIASSIFSCQIGNYSAEDITYLSTRLIQFQEEDSFANSGYFLTNLIMRDYQKTKRKEPYVVITEHLNTPLDYLCSKLHGLSELNETAKLNGPSVYIQGNTGKHTCDGMHSGNVTITGNIGPNGCYFMEGGLVTVHKNSEESLANHLNGGEIIIYGDTIENTVTQACSSMKKGIVTIKGNAKSIGHCMKGGKIIVEGNCTEHLGSVMYNGEIIVYGNAEYVGCEMRGGKITVQGKIENIGHRTTYNKEDGHSPFWGKIYEKDTQVFPPKDETIFSFLKRLKKKIRKK